MWRFFNVKDGGRLLYWLLKIFNNNTKHFRNPLRITNNNNDRLTAFDPGQPG